MFPIKSISGRILGFGGRIIDSNKKIAKYINSQKVKSTIKVKLYMVYMNLNSLLLKMMLLLVEGYMDVVQLHEHGIKNVLASSGTSLTKDQIILIKDLHQTLLFFLMETKQVYQHH